MMRDVECVIKKRFDEGLHNPECVSTNGLEYHETGRPLKGYKYISGSQYGSVLGIRFTYLVRIHFCEISVELKKNEAGPPSTRIRRTSTKQRHNSDGRRSHDRSGQRDLRSNHGRWGDKNLLSRQGNGCWRNGSNNNSLDDQGN
ncbi:hypothetical protein JHK86_000660 [Glycine max]|nr:hypothetical protein JHK86_000660 [Glycine max]